MHILNHKWKIAIAGAVLTGVFLFAATTHRTTQAAAPPAVRAVATSPKVEMMPIHAVGSMGGGGDLNATNKTD